MSKRFLIALALAYPIVSRAQVYGPLQPLPFKSRAVSGVPDWLKRLLICAVPIMLLCMVLNAIDSNAQANKPLTLTLLRKGDDLPSSVVLEATLQNVSKHDITLNAQDPIVDYTLIVTNERGVPVPFSKRGEEIFSRTVSVGRDL